MDRIIRKKHNKGNVANGINGFIYNSRRQFLGYLVVLLSELREAGLVQVVHFKDISLFDHFLGTLTFLSG